MHNFVVSKIFGCFILSCLLCFFYNDYYVFHFTAIIVYVEKTLGSTLSADTGITGRSIIIITITPLEFPPAKGAPRVLQSTSLPFRWRASRRKMETSMGTLCDLPIRPSRRGLSTTTWLKSAHQMLTVMAVATATKETPGKTMTRKLRT